MDIFHIRQELKTKPINDIPLRVTFYARVSSEKDEQLNSLKNQTDYYINYIKNNPKWSYVQGYIDEGISGISTEKRENFHRMIADAYAGKFDYIVTKEISRFARNTVDSISYTRELLRRGVAVFFQNDNINTLDEDSEFRLTIMAGVAQDEIRKLSSRVKFGHAQAIKNGVVLGNDNLYGYSKSGGRLIINEKEAEMVRFIFEQYSRGITTPRLEEALWEKGWRTRKGKKINRGVIQHIITNPKYKGYYTGNKVKIADLFTKQQIFLPEEEWVMYKDESGETVPAIVSEEVWNEANRIYKIRSDTIKERRSSFKQNNLFTGKIYCTQDGAAYWLKERYDSKGNNNSRWVCSHKLKNGAASCKSFAIMERELTEIIISVLNEVSGSFDEIVNRFIGLYEKSIESRDYEAEIKKLEKDAERINAKKEKILEYNIDGNISDSEFIKRNERFNNELEKIEEDIEAIKAMRNDEKLKIKEIYRLKQNFERFRFITKDDLTQNIVNVLIDKIYAEPVDERHMRLKILLNTGSSLSRVCKKNGNSGSLNSGRFGYTFKKMIEAQEKMMADKESGMGSTSR